MRLGQGEPEPAAGWCLGQSWAVFTMCTLAPLELGMSIAAFQDCTASMRRLLELEWGFAALQQISLSIKMVADTLPWTSATSPILVWLRGVP